MTEQEKIDQAAHKYATEKSTAPDKETPDWIGQDFKAGVTFALSELCPARMVEFAEWIRTFEALERQNGQWVIESQLSDKQIVKAFFEDIKQKDNVQPT